MLGWSILIGLLIALGVLAMTVGLIRAETSGELRVLTAAGASRRTRRALTSITAGTLGLVGGVLGIVTAYLLVGAFLANNFSGNLSELTWNLPLRPLGGHRARAPGTRRARRLGVRRARADGDGPTAHRVISAARHAARGARRT